MPWLRVDDQLPFHPKILAAGNAAMGLWLRAAAWSSGQLTDGHVPDHMITLLGGKKADTDKLVKAGLWERNGTGYLFHDWAEYNPSKAAVKEARSSRSQSASFANHNRWHRDRGKFDPECTHCTDRKAGQSTDHNTDQSTDQ